MHKVGILTFHFSTNYGGVLQSYALAKYLCSRGVSAEVINYVGCRDAKRRKLSFDIAKTSGIRKNPFSISKEDIVSGDLLRRIYCKIRYSRTLWKSFDDFRTQCLPLGLPLNETTIMDSLDIYSAIIVGSDQVWNPRRRLQSQYFLDFGGFFNGKKISYAADSTISDILHEDKYRIKKQLEHFSAISVRNGHSRKFVENAIGYSPPIVVDPTLLCDFNELTNQLMANSEPYIFVYVLGRDITGSNVKAINKIKSVYGDMKVYAVSIPTMKFNICNYADKVFYDLGPEEWLDMIRNASFVYTDSFHGTLFSLKFRKPFLAYYAEEMRATRFIDLGERYQIERYIVSNIDEIDTKRSLLESPNFDQIHSLIEEHKKESIRFLEEALNISK